MEKYILTDTVNGVHVSKDLQEVLTKAEDDVKKWPCCCNRKNVH